MSPPTVFEVQLSASNDDAEEYPSGKVNLNSTDLDMTFDGKRTQTIGMHFADIDIPRNAIITSAYIQFTADEVSTEPASLTIRGQDGGNAAAFTTASFDITSRPTTDAFVAWDPEAWTKIAERAPAERTPDLANIVQEIVDRPDWATLGDMAFIVSGSGTRTAEGADGKPGAAPLLHIEWLPPGSNEPAPVKFNDPPDADAASNAINQAAAAGTAVGITASASDPNPGDTVTYSIDDTRFAIDPDSGVITRAAGGTLDAGAEPTVTLQVTATSSDQSTVSQAFTLSVTSNGQLPSTATLVHTAETSVWSPPSPDPSDLVYVSHLGTFMVADGEVDEIPALFTGANLFEMTPQGALVGTGSTIAFSDEPAGIAYNPDNHHLFFSDDTGPRGVYELDPGADGDYGTGDDTVSFFKTGSDPEGITYDSNRGVLYLVGGSNDVILTINPGQNGRFDGAPNFGGDDVVTSFDLASLGIADPEGAAYDPVHDLLYIASSKRPAAIAMVSTTGELLGTLDISGTGVRKAAGIALAPSSLDPAHMSLYIADRNLDNNQQANENDGRIFELMLDWPMA